MPFLLGMDNDCYEADGNSKCLTESISLKEIGNDAEINRGSIGNTFVDGKQSDSANNSSNVEIILKDINGNEDINNTATSETSTDLSENAATKPPIYSRLKLNLTMLPSKVAYFAMSVSMSSLEPFQNVFLRSVGFSPTRVGMLTGGRMIAQIIGCPLWSLVADKTGRHQTVLTVLTICALCLNFSQPWTARYLDQNHQNRTCIDESSNSSRTLTTSDSIAPSSMYFFSMASILFAGGLVESAFEGFFDARTMQLIDNCSTKSTYGQQRFVGSIGDAIASLLTAYLIQNIASPGLSCYTPLFYVYLVGMTICIANIVFLFRKKIEEAKEDEDSDIWKPLIETLKKPDVIFFYTTALIDGMADGVTYGFFFMLLEDMKAKKIIMGIYWMGCSVIAALTFPVASRLIQVLGGPDFAMSVSISSYFLKFVLISYIKNEWLMLLTVFLHAFQFPLFWSVAVEKAYEFSPKQISFTILGTLDVVNVPVSVLISNMIGGVVYETFGGRWLFRGYSFLCLFWGGVCFIKAFVVRRRRSQSDQNENDDNHQNPLNTEKGVTIKPDPYDTHSLRRK